MNFSFFFVGNLHILYVTDEDWDGQEYGCGLWNEVTKTFTKGSMTSLNIKGGWGGRSDFSKINLSQVKWLPGVEDNQTKST